MLTVLTYSCKTPYEASNKYRYLNKDNQELEYVYTDSTSKISVDLVPSRIYIDSSENLLILEHEIQINLENYSNEEKEFKLFVDSIKLLSLKHKEIEPIPGIIGNQRSIVTSISPNKRSEVMFMVMYKIDNNNIKEYLKNKIVITFKSASFGDKTVECKPAIFFNKR